MKFSTTLSTTLSTILCFLLLLSSKINAQQTVIISEILTNPAGNDVAFEYVELVATQDINFVTTPYTVVFCNNGTATTNGWRAGGSITYAFEINTGTVLKGTVFYVGGNTMTPISNGCTIKRSKAVNTQTGDGGIGSSGGNGGVLGNGGSNADGVAVFDLAVANLTSSSVPIDMVFFGNSFGSAIVSGGSQGYQTPINDLYDGGKLQDTDFLATDPASAQTLQATAIYDTINQEFLAKRVWTTNSVPTDCNTNITLIPSNTPLILGHKTANSTYLSVNRNSPSYCSGVVNDPTDPCLTIGLVFELLDANTPLNLLTVTATSTNTAVVPNSNIVFEGSNGVRILKIQPTGVGYTTITITVSDGTNSSNYMIEYAASAAAIEPSLTDFHTGSSDASTCVLVGGDYMYVADDETNVLRLYKTNHSGMHSRSFDLSPFLGLTDLSGGVPIEIDLEASTQSTTIPNRVYWIGSYGNSSSGNPKPNRRRFFATDINGVGAAATMSVVGYDDFLSELLLWGDANGYAFTANYPGVAPKEINGLNIEGLEIAPNGLDLYIAFRAPFVPVATRRNALIAPILNFESWFNNGTPLGSPTFGAPIELDLGVRGFRSIQKNNVGDYLIVAGHYDSIDDFQLFSWSGNPADAPIAFPLADVSGLNPEGIVSISDGPITTTTVVELLCDNGTVQWYSPDATESKLLPNVEHQKFRTVNIRLDGATSLPVELLNFNGVWVEKSKEVHLYWATGSELNSDFYLVERSMDGIEWVTIGLEQAAGDSKKLLSYGLNDQQPSSGINYYRLKQVDIDGSYRYSSIVAVEVDLNIEEWVIYPNPTRDFLQLRHESLDVNETTVQVWNYEGKAQSISVEAADNFLTVNVQNLAAGVYVMNIKTGENYHTKTFTIQD